MKARWLVETLSRAQERGLRIINDAERTGHPLTRNSAQMLAGVATYGVLLRRGLIAVIESDRSVPIVVMVKKCVIAPKKGEKEEQNGS